MINDAGISRRAKPVSTILISVFPVPPPDGGKGNDMKRGLTLLLAALLLLPLAACGANDSDTLPPVEYPADEVIERAVNGLPKPEKTACMEDDFSEEVTALLLARQRDGILPEERSSAWFLGSYPDSDNAAFVVAGARFEDEETVRWYLVPADCSALYSLGSAGSTEYDSEECNSVELLWKLEDVLTASDTGSKRAMDLLAAHVELPEGMVLLDYGIAKVNDADCYTIAAGKNTDEKFTAEQYYYISLDYSRIDRFDVLTTELVPIWSAG